MKFNLMNENLEILDFLLKDHQYYEDFITRSVNASNRIEGSKLDCIETAAILWYDNSIVLHNIKPRDFYETVNLKAAHEIMLDTAKENRIISKEIIIRLNEAINKDILDTKGYRNVQVYIKGVKLIPPSPLEVEEKMKAIIDEINSEVHLTLLERIAKFHILFEHIHPFIDANGRTGRLLINLELLKHGGIPIIIPDDKKIDYFRKISDYDIKGLTDMFTELQKKEWDRITDFIDMSKEKSRQSDSYAKGERKKSNEMAYGYKCIEHKLVIDEHKAKNVKKIFRDYMKYSEHPPKELVLAVMEESSIRGETLSYGDAEKQVSNDDIMRYIAEDINKKNSSKSHVPQRER